MRDGKKILHRFIRALTQFESACRQAKLAERDYGHNQKAAKDDISLTDTQRRRIFRQLKAQVEKKQDAEFTTAQAVEKLVPDVVEIVAPPQGQSPKGT